MNTIEQKIKKYKTKLNYYLKLKSLQTGGGAEELDPKVLVEQTYGLKKNDVVRFTGVIQSAGPDTLSDKAVNSMAKLGMDSRNISDADVGKIGTITNVELKETNYRVVFYLDEKTSSPVPRVARDLDEKTSQPTYYPIITVKGELDGKFFGEELEKIIQYTPQNKSQKHELEPPS
jgi:hypothetical protein